MIIKGSLLRYRRFLIVLVNMGIVLSAYFLACLLRFDFDIPERNIGPVLRILPLLLVAKLSCLWYFQLFSGMWRYVSIDDLWRILKASTLSTVVIVLGAVFMYGLVAYPRSVFVIDWVLFSFFMAGIRLASRIFREKIKAQVVLEKRKKTLIVGAGEAGVAVVKESRNNPSLGIDVIGFIDDDVSKHNESIYGVRVLGGRKDIPAIAESEHIDQIILAVSEAKGEVVRDILTYCELPDVKIKIVPPMGKILGGDLEVRPRDVRPEDLLGREKIEINDKEIGSYLKGKRVLVTGAGGSIGSELCRQIAKYHPEKIVLFDHNENDVYFLVVEFKTRYPNVKFRTIIGDIRDVGLLKQVFTRFKPQVVFHAAAHKHVPLMEENAVAAVKNNVMGTLDLVYAAAHYKVERFVLISTDKAVNPVNVMGMSKRIAEIIMQAKATKSVRTKFMAVRFGNVLGSAGSVVPLFKKQIEEGGPVTVTDPETKRYFMSIPEAVSLVLQAGAIGKGGEIFILDMGEQIKIADLAKNLISLSGLKPEKDIEIKFVGLRPGEKLYEDILLDKEKDHVTKHDRIFVTPPTHMEPAALRKHVKELHRLASLMAEEKVVRKMREIIDLANR